MHGEEFSLSEYLK